MDDNNNNNNIHATKKRTPLDLPLEARVGRITGTHAHGRIDFFPDRRAAKLDESGTSLLSKEERRHFQGLGIYEDLVNLHFELEEKGPSDLTSLFKFFRDRGQQIHMIQVQQRKKATSLLFCFDIEREILWIGFYFKVSSNESIKEVNNPFVSQLDFSKDDDLKDFLLSEIKYKGFLFNVCPCVK